MKGISHFISGVAVASFLPQAVRLSAGGSFILLCAGLGGIMPDTLDFRLARYLAKPDVEIDPHPSAPDPQAMAQQIAGVIDRVHETGKSIAVRFHTVKLGADRWRQYVLNMGGREREVRVRIGPVVTTSRAPFPGSEPDLPEGRAATVAAAHCAYGAETTVDILDGPSFEFRRRGDAVEIVFLPWHRRWSHSLPITALLGALVALLLGPLPGLVYALGSIVHIAEDQLGYLGTNLFYPFTRTRIRGFRLFHSGDVIPNLFAVWSSIVLILFNLDRFSSDPVLNPWPYLGIALVLTWTVILGMSWWRGRQLGVERPPTGDLLAAVTAETEEIID